MTVIAHSPKIEALRERVTAIDAEIAALDEQAAQAHIVNDRPAISQADRRIAELVSERVRVIAQIEQFEAEARDRAEREKVREAAIARAQESEENRRLAAELGRGYAARIRAGLVVREKERAVEQARRDPALSGQFGDHLESLQSKLQSRGFNVPTRIHGLPEVHDIGEREAMAVFYEQWAADLEARAPRK